VRQLEARHPQTKLGERNRSEVKSFECGCAARDAAAGWRYVTAHLARHGGLLGRPLSRNWLFGPFADGRAAGRLSHAWARPGRIDFAGWRATARVKRLLLGVDRGSGCGAEDETEQRPHMEILLAAWPSLAPRKLGVFPIE